MPVRVRIHSSFVSTSFSRSKLVTTRGGRYPATPVIFAAIRLPIQVSVVAGIVSTRLYAIGRGGDKRKTAAGGGSVGGKQARGVKRTICPLPAHRGGYEPTDNGKGISATEWCKCGIMRHEQSLPTGF